MSYFKINGVDFSKCVNQLTIDKKSEYSAQTNAAGNTVVDYINAKRIIQVGIIPLSGEELTKLLTAIDGFNVSISFMNPITNSVEENVNCIIPNTGVDYYTIQAGKIMLDKFKLKFQEL